jgi:copper chaperone CopZ
MAEPTDAANAPTRDQLTDATADPHSVVAQLADAGHEDARTILPEAQGEALIWRDLLDYTRQQAEDALGVSKSTIDDRLGRAHRNVEAVAEVARLLLDLGLLDPDDLGLDAEQQTVEVVAPDPDDAQNPEEPETEDETPGGWAAIMALNAVTEVTRSPDGSAATVQVDDATDDDLDAIEAALADLGLRVYGTENYGDSGRVKLRAKAPGEDAPESAETDAQGEADPEEVHEGHDDEAAETDAQEGDESDDEDALTCHFCADEFTVDEDEDPDLLVTWNDDAEHPACSSCLTDAALGDEKEPLAEFRDDDLEDEQVDETVEGATDGLADDLAALDLPGDDEVLDERRAAVRACYDHLHAAGEASRKSFLDAVYPDHEVGYGSGASWWSSFMGDALEALAARRDDLNPPENARAGDKWTPGDEEGSA